MKKVYVVIKERDEQQYLCFAGDRVKAEATMFYVIDHSCAKPTKLENTGNCIANWMCYEKVGEQDKATQIPVIYTLFEQEGAE